MHDPNTTLLLAAAGLAGLAMLIAGTLAGWRGWLALKAQQFAGHAGPVRLAPGGRADRDRRSEGAYPQAGGDRGGGGALIKGDHCPASSPPVPGGHDDADRHP